MKAVFLDVDGVLHPLCGGQMFLVSHLNRLKKIVESAPNTRIVLSSSWRTSDVSTQMVQDSLHKVGIRDPIFDRTPEHRGSRQLEILHWLHQHNNKHPKTSDKYVDGWVVLDDIHMAWGTYGAIFEKHAVCTKSQVGLTDEDTEKAIQILKLTSDEIPEVKLEK